MSSQLPPPPHPQLHNLHHLSMISSPPRIYRWLNGTGEFGDQPISPSNNVPNRPLSEDQYVMDNGVDLKSPSSGTHPPASHNDIDAAESSQESVQAEAPLPRSYQQVLAIARRFPCIGAQRLPLNQQFHANNGFENPPVPYSRDNANQGIHERNNQQLNPMEFPLQGIVPQGLPLNQLFHASQPRNDSEYPATPYSTNNANQGMHDRNNRMEYPSYPAALQHGNGYPGNMMSVNNHLSAPRYNNTRPLGQRAHQMGMTTGMLNTMSYPRGTSDQVLGNSLFNPVNGPNQFHSEYRSNYFHLVNNSNQPPSLNGPNQFPPVIGSNRVPLVNSSNQVTPFVPRQQDDTSHTNNDLPTPEYVILGRFTNTSLTENAPAFPTNGNNLPVAAHSGIIDDASEDDSSSSTSYKMTSSELEILHNIRNETATPHGHTSDQRAPGPVGTGLDIPNVPSNIPSNQHTVSNDQGEMPSSVGDQMDFQQDPILFGALSTIPSLAQLFNFIADAGYPSNANYPGPLFPQDTRSRRPLQLGSNPMFASDIEETGAALGFEEADTLPASISPSNILNTLRFDTRQPQMETPYAANPPGNTARNQRSGIRMDPPWSTNRVNKSVRRRKPAKTQRLQSQIANNASCVLDHLTSQAIEAQKDSDTDAESEEE